MINTASLTTDIYAIGQYNAEHGILEPTLVTTIMPAVHGITETEIRTVAASFNRGSQYNVFVNVLNGIVKVYVRHEPAWMKRG